MNRKAFAVVAILLFVNYQTLSVTIDASIPSHIKKQESESYQWIWEELSSAPSSIIGEDVVFWGESLGPYHNYTEISSKLSLLNSTFSEFVDLYSIGQTWHGRDIWCVKLTNETITTPKTEFYIVGAHHARELISVENCLYFIDKIIY